MDGKTFGEPGTARMTAGPIFLYDGDCGVCTRSVRFVLDRDRGGAVRFASLQGDVAAEFLARRPELAGLDSMIWIHATDGQEPVRFAVRSDAAIAVGRYLGGFWGILARIARVVPRRVRDWAYDAFARHRKGLPGLAESCILPTPEETPRFLDG